jgi:hypothetical protein
VRKRKRPSERIRAMGTDRHCYRSEPNAYRRGVLCTAKLIGSLKTRTDRLLVVWRALQVFVVASVSVEYCTSVAVGERRLVYHIGCICRAARAERRCKPSEPV